MRALRGSEVPIEHMAAELAALPLCSDASFELSITELDPRMMDRTAQLWRGIENQLLQSFSAFSVEEVTALRDWLWFDQASRVDEEGKLKPLHLVEFVRFISSSALDFVGNVFKPKMPPWAREAASFAPSGSVDARARRFWRWVSFALPPDFLMSAHPEIGAVSADVELLSPILANILRDRGYAETHMHLGAALEFGLLWISTLHAVADPELINERSFESPGGEFDQGKLMARWLVRAAIARYVLAAFLAHRRRHQIPNDMTLDGFLIKCVYPLFQVDKSGEASDIDESEFSDYGRRYAYVDPGRGAAVRLCLHELATGRLAARTPFSHLQRLYSQLTNLKARWLKFPDTYDAAWYADPIVTMFPPLGLGQRTSEMSFTAAGVDYLAASQGRSDLTFRHLFWQLQRVRCRYYRHVVQRPLTPGLQWFIRTYSRIFPGRQLLGTRAMVASAAKICGLNFGLTSLEFRLSPPPDQSTLRGVLVDVGQALRDLNLLEAEPARRLEDGGSLAEVLSEARKRRVWSGLVGEELKNIRLTEWKRKVPEVGVVLHFARERGGGAEAGMPTAHGIRSHGDPGMEQNLGYRYSFFYKKKRREAQTIAGLLRRFPQLLALVRGIDVCTDELGVPNWVLAPLFRYVKQIAGAASSFAQAQLRHFLPPLRTTAHAGEDFVHLLGGLRRIEESITCFQLGQGDRLGHAIALGISPGDWATRIGGIAMTRLERLFDLAWEWSFCIERSLNLPPGRTQYIIEKIETLSKEIFNSYSHPPQVAKFMQLLRDEKELRLAGFPSGPLVEERKYIKQVRREHGFDRRGGEREEPSVEDRRELGEDPWRLLYAYLTDPQAFAAGQKQVLVDPAFEAASLEIIQAELRRKIGTAGIIVEINPSSNLLIGNFSDLQNHPLWRLKSPRGDEGVRVAVCIGSDDPLTFATRTREEYQLVYDTLTLAGLSDSEARVWLEEVRQAGQDSRFTLPLPQVWNWIPADMEVDVRHVRDVL